MTTMLWKPHIIRLTESSEARSLKIDASFFPPLAEATLTAWQQRHGHVLPEAMRSYLLQSDGLEAQKGHLWPVLPFADWEYFETSCCSPHPWLRFGRGMNHHYYLSLGDTSSIYRTELAGSAQEFFAQSFPDYLRRMFLGQG